MLYWYDTTENRNNDFRMSNVPDNTYTEDLDCIQPFLNDDQGMLYNKGEFRTFATIIQGEPLEVFLNQNNSTDFNKYNYYENAKQVIETSEDDDSYIQDNIVLVKNEDSFDQWTNLIDPSVTLTGSQFFQIDPSNTSYYYNESFFPIDGLGFGEYEQKNKNHNYFWCSRIRFLSQVPMDQDKEMIIKYGASDDKFLFVNDELVYSFIGVTDRHEKEILINNNTDINGRETMQPGDKFVIDFINCNRKDRDDYHLLSIDANFPLFCI
ncbi:hypothetical protein DICPUDRAFT_91455 [Dictyostelium purpureum]|uniref:PA14 domain-containing protein n=1 Tax=Dictyostelium purpureum TaxID=5786 RepID=F0ZCN2_DICPU|nr:uncharacterized protein DICPUDRAFT_91455 [Dictyostelium purpureum]EGC38301.1 hypothetical protein DICPUDRAFT_91455 [Dictyostelium purpureum]|eukprot:XP_003285162.1 hypothetical protein DICPUDRAFT_91455 [Dictyostelium purpureum]